MPRGGFPSNTFNLVMTVTGSKTLRTLDKQGAADFLPQPLSRTTSAAAAAAAVLQLQHNFLARSFSDLALLFA